MAEYNIVRTPDQQYKVNEFWAEIRKKPYEVNVYAYNPRFTVAPARIVKIRTTLELADFSNTSLFPTEQSLYQFAMQTGV